MLGKLDIIGENICAEFKLINTIKYMKISFKVLNQNPKYTNNQKYRELRITKALGIALVSKMLPEMSLFNLFIRGINKDFDLLGRTLVFSYDNTNIFFYLSVYRILLTCLNRNININLKRE